MKAPEREGYTFLHWKGSEYYEGDGHCAVHSDILETARVKNRYPKLKQEDANGEYRIPFQCSPTKMSGDTEDE